MCLPSPCVSPPFPSSFPLISWCSTSPWALLIGCLPTNSITPHTVHTFTQIRLRCTYCTHIMAVTHLLYTSISSGRCISSALHILSWSLSTLTSHIHPVLHNAPCYFRIHHPYSWLFSEYIQVQIPHQVCLPDCLSSQV